ncbi:hypothetical protein Tco_0364424 [Tanacetum coccineum]
MLQREILLDVVGTLGYCYEVLQSFPMERIEQENEWCVLSLFATSRLIESTRFNKSLRCWFGLSDRSLWKEHPFCTNRMVSDQRECHAIRRPPLLIYSTSMPYSKLGRLQEVVKVPARVLEQPEHPYQHQEHPQLPPGHQP